MNKIENYRYGCWAGNNKGYPYKKEQCAKEVIPSSQGGFIGKQCSKKNGYGLNGLFCKQHKERTEP